MIIEDKRNKHNMLYNKVRYLYYNMQKRCNDVNHKAYVNYGNKGVKISNEWNSLDGFIRTIDKVQGWNLEKFLNGELSLDKDSLIKNNKIYSVETCVFISKEENNKYKPNQQKEFIATSPEGIEFKIFNQSEFAKIHNLNQTNISACLNGRMKTHKKWKFRY